jgi:hypothetical protein
VSSRDPNAWLFRPSLPQPESETENRERSRRFAVFAGEGVPEGGWRDFVQAFFTRGAALRFARQQLETHEVDWASVVDLRNLEEVTSDD